MDNYDDCILGTQEENMENFYEQEQDKRSKRIPITYAMNILFVITIVSLLGLMWQNSIIADLKAEEAYTVSVVINVAERNLLLKYGAFPEDVGLEELRAAWIKDPCLETATAYADALRFILEALDPDSRPEYIDLKFEVYQV